MFRAGSAALNKKQCIRVKGRISNNHILFRQIHYICCEEGSGIRECMKSDDQLHESSSMKLQSNFGVWTHDYVISFPLSKLWTLPY